MKKKKSDFSELKFKNKYNSINTKYLKNHEIIPQHIDVLKRPTLT